MKQNEKIDFQNEKIQNQNKLFEEQNTKMNIQNHLMEAERRSSLVFLMSNILDNLDKEIKEQIPKSTNKNSFDTVEYTLSNTLVARIIDLSKALKPYRIMENDKLEQRAFSPERGQLFIALTSIHFDSLTNESIFKNSDFSYSKIRKIDLTNYNLRGINLKNADLSNAILNDVDFRNAQLDSTILYKTKLKNALLKGAILDYANFINSDLEGIDVDLKDDLYYNIKIMGTIFDDTRISNDGKIPLYPNRWIPLK